MKFRIIQLGKLEMQDLKLYMEMMLFCMYGETARQEESLEEVLETRGTTVANVYIFQRDRTGSNVTV